MVLGALSRYWWLVALRGALAVAFGAAAVVWPVAAFAVLVILFGAYALADGVVALAALLVGRGRSWALALEAVVGLGIGVATLLTPGVTAAFLLALAGTMAIVTGVLEVVAAVRLRKEIEGEFWLGLAGVVSVLFGAAMLGAPAFGVVAVGLMAGLYALSFGITMLSLAVRLRRHHHRGGVSPPAAAVGSGV